MEKSFFKLNSITCLPADVFFVNAILFLKRDTMHYLPLNLIVNSRKWQKFVQINPSVNCVSDDEARDSRRESMMP